MPQTIASNPFASELLEVSASGYAAQATDRMLDAHPDIRQAFAPGAHLGWRDHMHLRVRELAAAVNAGRPDLFTSRVLWSWQSFAARGIERSALNASLLALRGVLNEKLPEAAAAEPVQVIDLAIEALSEPLPDEKALLDAADPAQAVALSYLQTVLEGDVRAAIDLVLAEHYGGRSAYSIICDVLLPAQAEIGRLWHLNQLSDRRRTPDQRCHRAHDRAGRRPAPSTAPATALGARGLDAAGQPRHRHPRASPICSSWRAGGCTTSAPTCRETSWCAIGVFRCRSGAAVGVDERSSCAACGR
jgi:hypothetical protein